MGDLDMSLSLHTMQSMSAQVSLKTRFNTILRKLSLFIAAPKIPEALLNQLAPGGKMIIPVGQYEGNQQIMMVRKSLEGKITQKALLDVRYVPLTDKEWY